MTDKQIIIDGVDVSGCEFFDSGNCVECDMRVHFYGDIPCDDECNRNCYYKQLKRKEQECEELKAKCKKYGEINEQETKDYAELKAENDELKKQLTAYIKEAEENFEVHTTLKDNYRKLYQTLTEIKEIIHFNKTNRLSGGADISIEQILQKISEVVE